MKEDNKIFEIQEKKIDELIHLLDQYARDTDRYCLGLPIYDEHMDSMRNLVKQFLKDLNK